MVRFVRYEKSFLVGISGSRKFVEGVRLFINNFIKSNLHLKIKKDDLINRNEKSVKFLGFKLCLSIRKRSSIGDSFCCYKRKVLAKLRCGNIRLANAAVFAIKKDLLQLIRLRLERSQLR